jgi:hypothetical protein
MISEAIQVEVQKVITNTAFAIEGEEIEVPFCVHKEKQTPVRLKSGVSGYENSCELMIIDKLPDSVETLKTRVRTAIEAMEGITISGTAIESVDYLGDDPDFDMQSQMYYTIMNFNIETSNI